VGTNDLASFTDVSGQMSHDFEGQITLDTQKNPYCPSQSWDIPTILRDKLH